MSKIESLVLSHETYSPFLYKILDFGTNQIVGGIQQFDIISGMGVSYLELGRDPFDFYQKNKQTQLYPNLEILSFQDDEKLGARIVFFRLSQFKLEAASNIITRFEDQTKKILEKDSSSTISVK